MRSSETVEGTVFDGAELQNGSIILACIPEKDGKRTHIQQKKEVGIETEVSYTIIGECDGSCNDIRIPRGFPLKISVPVDNEGQVKCAAVVPTAVAMPG